MKITYDLYLQSVKSRVEKSTLINGLWIARSAINVNFNGIARPILGYSARYDKDEAVLVSKYELLEKLVFLPSLYDEVSIEKPVKYLFDFNELTDHNSVIRDFLVGAKCHNGFYYGNGCALHADLYSSILHSKNELIERHLCCDFWYKKRSLIWIESCKADFRQSMMDVQLFTTVTDDAYKFALAVVDISDLGYFSFGAAVKRNLKDACSHAIGEAAMIYEDVSKGRVGDGANSSRLLSLRDKEVSRSRKAHFESLLKRTLNEPLEDIDCTSVYFEPMPGLYAARTFSFNALDPRVFERDSAMPILPLF